MVLGRCHCRYGNAQIDSLLLDSKNPRTGPKAKKTTKQSFDMLDEETIKVLNDHWEDSEQSSLMWELISTGSGREFMEVLQEYPELAHIRSAE